MVALYGYAFFVLYSFLGWICESTYVSIPKGYFVNRGFFYGPYIPIYGFGALIAVYILLPYVSNPIAVFLLGAILCTILEYVTSWIMEVLFHMRWWDYSNKKWNIKGRVCLLNTVLFGIMSTVVVYIVHPAIQDIFMHIPVLWISHFLSAFSSCFVIDGIFTLITLIRRKHIIEKIHEQMESLQLEFEADLNQRMQGLEKKMEAFDEKRLVYDARMKQLKQDVQLRQNEFMRWIQNQPKMERRIEDFRKNMAHYSNLMHTHVDKAYPNRSVNEHFEELQKMAEEFVKKLGSN